MRCSWLLVVAALAGCGRAGSGPTAGAPWVPEPAPELGAVVARVGEVPVFAAEVRAQAVRTGRPPRDALEDLVRFHLLAARARASGVPAAAVDDERAVKEILVQRLVEREFEPRARPEDIPDADLRALYQRTLDQFVHPRLVEIAVLSVYTGARMKPGPRAQRRQVALELKAFVDRRPVRTWEDLQQVAADPVWRGRPVSFARQWQGLDKPFGRAVGEAAAKLAAPGDTTPLVEDESGYHIARYISERPPRNVSFEQARAEIRAGYYPHWRKQVFAEFGARLAATRKVELYPDRIAAE